MPEKLIRDRIPDIAAARGQAPMTVRQAAVAEMPGLLLAKLHEELAEVREADAGGVLEELADLLEVVFALAAWHGCDRGDLREIARAKAEARGGFDGRLVWTAAPAAGEGRNVSPTAALLASRCDACRHTLNRHDNQAGCTVPLCVCGRFQPPADEAGR